jgi:hypothetical protein
MPTAAAHIVPLERIEGLIYLVRGQKVMLDSDLAALYGVATKVLNQAVRRNLQRFPDDFMFQLTEAEAALILRSQIVTLKPRIWSQAVTSSNDRSRKANRNKGFPELNWSQFVTSSRKHRGRAYRVLAFTELGVAMLSSILNSSRAVQVNIEIMRAFVRLRQLLGSNAELSRKLAALEKKYDRRFKVVFEAIRELMAKPKSPPRREIGFHAIPTASAGRNKTKAKSLLP